MATLDHSGAWRTDFGDLKLSIQGSRVTGTYGPNNGSLQGTLSNNVITGNWKQVAPCNHGITYGTFVITLAADGSSFRGQWSYLDDFVGGGGTWIGKR